MIILLGDKERIDFGGPVVMNEVQKDKFIKFFESMFSIVDVEHINEPRIERLGDKFFPRKWTPAELKILLDVQDTAEVAERLGRSWMSVDIQRGSFLTDFMEWTKVKGKDILSADEGLIAEYMKEVESKKQERRKKKAEENKEKRRYRDLLYKLTHARNEPCKVGDPQFSGGECRNGFHDGCITCPRSQDLIRKEDVALLNEAYKDLLHSV